MWEEKIRGNTRMRRSGVSRVTSDRIAGGRENWTLSRKDGAPTISR